MPNGLTSVGGRPPPLCAPPARRVPEPRRVLPLPPFGDELPPSTQRSTNSRAMTSSHLRYKDVKGYTLGVRIGGGGFSTSVSPQASLSPSPSPLHLQHALRSMSPASPLPLSWVHANGSPLRIPASIWLRIAKHLPSLLARSSRSSPIQAKEEGLAPLVPPARSSRRRSRSTGRSSTPTFSSSWTPRSSRRTPSAFTRDCLSCWSSPAEGICLTRLVIFWRDF